MDFDRNIEHLVNAIERAREENIKVNLLVGAGCSVSAGIPLADEIVNDLEERYEDEIKCIEIKNYGDCMSKLTPVERRRLINSYVSNAKINWAHIGIANLVKKGYIDRVLTTNFDNIIPKACSLVGEYPGIYDLAMCKEFRSDLISEKAILYLHGQHTGFVLCNTKSEIKAQKRRLRPILKNFKEKSMWIIIGYSCQNDAVWEILREEKSFDNRLYLVGYNENDPNENMKKILGEDKYSFYIRGYDADSFFIALMKKLDEFPPKIIEKPFSYLEETLNEITPYSDNESYFKDDVHIITKDILNDAIREFEEDKVKMAKFYYQINMHNKFTEKIKEIENDNSNKELIKKLSKAIKEVDSQFIDKIEKFLNDGYCIDDDNILEKLEEADIVISLNADNSKCYELRKKIDSMYDCIDEKRFDSNNIINRCDLLIYLYEYNKTEKVFLEKAEKICIKNNEIFRNKYAYEVQLCQIYISFIDWFTINKETEKQKIYIDKVLVILDSIEKLAYDNENMIVNLATLYIKLINYVNEKDKENYFNKINLLFESAYKINNNPNTISVWGRRLNDIRFDESSELEKKRILISFEKLKSSIETQNDNADYNFIIWVEVIMQIISFKSTDDYLKYIDMFLDTTISNLNKFKVVSCEDIFNTIAYRLIKINEFRMSRKILDEGLNINGLDPYLIATLGYWYYTNNDIDEYEAEEKGKYNYEKAIDLVEDDNVREAFRLKYRFEYGKFMITREKDVEEGKKIVMDIFNEKETELNKQVLWEVESFIIDKGYIKEIEECNNIHIKEIADNAREELVASEKI